MKEAVIGKILEMLIIILYVLLVGLIIVTAYFNTWREIGKTLLTIEILLEALMMLRIFIKQKEVDAIFVMRLEVILMNLFLILMTKAIFFQ